MKKLLPTSSLLLLGVIIASPVLAQSIITQTEVRESLPGMLMPSAVYTTKTKKTVVQTTPAATASTVTTELTGDILASRRSNYEKRLSDIMAQINMAESRGWITAARAEELRKWNSDCLTEVSHLRVTNGTDGVVSLADVDLLERHLNGLAYTINRELGQVRTAGSNTTIY